jgi:pullulanase-type alpha-1,6-glucosidase
MMEKLMVDAVVTWAREYKIDGFRFDLMGHHLVMNMNRVQEALQSLTPQADGVHGKAVYLYGEGWDFGGLSGNARGPNATGRNLAGSGIGTFNDRFRDAARGGGPFQGLQEQGVITGLFLDPNETNQGKLDSQLQRLLDLKDLVRLGLAGNLVDYPLENRVGATVLGSGYIFQEGPAAVSHSPQEHVPYLEAHDNETLFDAIQYKAPVNLPMSERVRMQNLGISLLALSQGVPFFHAGMEILRSKSLDRDSYDSGDWFNRLDFSYQENNWGIGLPFFDKNGGNWPVMKGLLSRAALKPLPEHILAALHHFEEMLAIRRSSPYFRMASADDVRENLQFYNTGPEQAPGIIAMSLGVGVKQKGTFQADPLMVLFNFGKEQVRFRWDGLRFVGLQLHPVLAVSSDSVVQRARFDPKTQTFFIPPRTTAVFIHPGEG